MDVIDAIVQQLIRKITPGKLETALFPITYLVIQASFLGLALLLLGSGAADAFRDIAFLPYLGKFEFTFHGVQGDIYQVDDSTIFVHRFYYDGDGPEGAGVSFMAVPRGENDYGKGQPMDIRMETARNHGRGARFEEIKEAVYNQNLTVKLPRRGKVEGVDDIGRLVFWCNKYGVSFGRVDLDEAREAPLINRPMLDLLYIGSFLQTEHGVNGDVYIMYERHRK